MLEKSFDKENFGKVLITQKFGKINYKRKIFITKMYSNIDKCHTIFALLATFDRTGRKTGSNENVCGIWFKMGSVVRSHWTQVMWRFKRSREERHNHGLRTVRTRTRLRTRLPHERYLLHRWYEKFYSSGLPPLWSGGALSATKKSNVVHQLSYGVNHSISMVLIHRL